MLTRWKVGNFKSIREPINLDLAPLTIFSGINSSGKSTLIQSILLLAQSVSSIVDDEALILNGRFLQLGRLRDISHHGLSLKDHPFEIGFEWMPPHQLMNYESLVIRAEARIKKSERRRKQGKAAKKFYPYVEKSTISFAPYQRLQGNTRMNILQVSAVDEDPSFFTSSQVPPRLREDIEHGLFDYVLSGIQERERGTFSVEDVVRVALTNILPTRLLVGIDSEIERLITDVNWITELLDIAVKRRNPSLPYSPGERKFSPLLRDVINLTELKGVASIDDWESRGAHISELRRALAVNKGNLDKGWLVNRLKNRDYSVAELKEFRVQLAAALSTVLADTKQINRLQKKKLNLMYEERLPPAAFLEPMTIIQKFFTEQIFYLGPLRDDPRVIYDQPPLAEPWSVGLKGEYTAAMLDEHRNFKIDYPTPPEDRFSGTYFTKEGPLIEAIVLWLRRMGLVDSVDTEETPKVGYRLTVNSPGLDVPLDLTSVGVGVSQVLPTLVMALLAPVGSTLIFEQPELHLHPKVQSVMGDFFLAISQMGKQCLVETHSEHLINRLRRRIVEATKDNVRHNIRIYFAEKDGPVSRFQEVESNEFGTILKWPHGFFDEAENEASMILQLQMEKRRMLREESSQEKDGA